MIHSESISSPEINDLHEWFANRFGAAPAAALLHIDLTCIRASHGGPYYTLFVVYEN